MKSRGTKLPELGDASDLGTEQHEFNDNSEEVIDSEENQGEHEQESEYDSQGDLAADIASSKNISNREKRLRWLLEKTQKTIQNEDPLASIENKSLLVSEVRPVREPEFAMDIHLEAKMKHIIDIYMKLLYLNKTQIPLVNYNLKDAYRLLDSPWQLRFCIPVLQVSGVTGSL